MADEPFAFLSTDTVPQAGAFSVRVSASQASSASAAFNGQQIQLLPNADGTYLVGLFGAGQAAGDEQEIDPGDYTVEVNMVDPTGAPSSFSLPITVSSTDFPVDQVYLPPSTAALLDPSLLAQEATTLQQFYAPTTPEQLWTGLFRRPLDGPITTHFGQARSYNGGPVSGHHSGVDIAAPLGTPVPAAAAGAVAWTGRLSERGNFVAIDHGLGVYTGYAHLSKISTSPGMSVAMGDIVGLVGTTGLSTGPHLHWEVAVHAMNVDALRWTWIVLP